jgi:hypothetical protein
MGCSSCGGGQAQAEQTFIIYDKYGYPTGEEVKGDVAAKQAVTRNGGGTFKVKASN